jgi:hypothetical protein
MASNHSAVDAENLWIGMIDLETASRTKTDFDIVISAASLISWPHPVNCRTGIALHTRGPVSWRQFGRA